MSVSVCQMQVYRPYAVDAPYTTLSAVASPESSRKRTTSFSSPPRKRLHRTDSFVDLSFAVATPPQPQASTSQAVPYTRTLRFYKEQKERRRALLRREPPTAAPVSAPPPTPTTTPTTPARALAVRAKSTPPPPPPPPPRVRSTPPSPLAVAASSSSVKSALTPPPPVRAPLPTRPSPSSHSSAKRCNPFSSSPPSAAPPSPKRNVKGKAPDLHRRAVTACMRASPAGAKILHMGARLAVGIMSATRELERMCSVDSLGSSESYDDDDDGEDEGMGMDEEDVDDIDAEGVEDEDVLALGLSLSDEETAAPLTSSVGRLIAEAVSFSSALAAPLEDADVPMPDVDAPAMSASWIVVGANGEQRDGCVGAGGGDWEMVAL